MIKNRLRKNLLACVAALVSGMILVGCGSDDVGPSGSGSGENRSGSERSEERVHLYPLKHSSGKYGYINLEGEWAIAPDFQSVGTFYDSGYAVVTTEEGEGIIDTTGRFLVGPGLGTIVADGGDIVLGYTDSNRQQFWSLDGKRLFGRTFDRAELFRDGLAIVETDDYNKGMIGRNGEWVIPAEFQSIERNFERDFIPVQIMRNVYAVIDASYSDVVPPGTMSVLALAGHDLAKALDGMKCGYVNRRGEVAIPLQFQRCTDFEANGYAAVAKDGVTYGVINSTGSWVVEPSYSHVTTLSETTVWPVEKDDLWGLVDVATGKVVLDAQYGWIGPSNHSETYAFEDRSGMYGVVNSKGDVLIEPRFNSTSSMVRGGLVKVSTSDDLFGVIDSSGEFVIDPEYSRVIFRDELIHVWRPDGTQGYYRSDNLEEVAVSDQK